MIRMKKQFTFDFVEKQIRKQTFGIISTVSEKGWPQASGILYGVSDPKNKFYLAVITEQSYKKVQNIKANNKVSFIIPFPHHFMRLVPSNTISFQATTEIRPWNDQELMEIFTKKRILRMNLDVLEDYENKDDIVFVKLIPKGKILAYGVGIGMMELRKSHTTAGYSVEIPPERL